MIWTPRIRLQTIFLLFFCAAVGLTSHSGGEYSFESANGIEAAIATAMVIGLLQQTWQLIRSKPVTVGADDGLNFAWRYALVWRTAVTAVIATTVTVQILIAKGLLTYPKN